MSNEKHNIDELFRSKLSEYSLDVPDQVWKNIEAKRTPLYRAVNYFKNKRGAVVSTLLLIGVGATAFFASNALTNTAVPAQKGSAPLIAQTEAAPVNTSGKTATISNTTTPANQQEYIQASWPAATQQNTPHNAVNNGGNQNPQTNSVAPVNTANNGDATTTTDNNTTTNTINTADNSTNTTDTDTKNTNSNTESENNFTQTTQAQIVPVENENTEVAQSTKENTEELVTTETETEGTDATEKQQGMAVKPPQDKARRFSIDAYTSLDFAGRQLSANGVNASYLDAKKQAESYTPGYSTGLRLNYNINSALKLRAGLQYSQINEKLSYNGQTNYTRIDTSIGYVIDPNTGKPTGATYTRIDTVNGTRNVNVNGRNAYTFIDVPLQLELSLYRTKKVSLFATGGAAINLRFSQRGMQLKQDLSGGTEIHTANPYKTNAGLTLMGGLGMEYRCSETSPFSLLVEGIYRHGTGNVFGNNAGMVQNYRVLSGTVGLRYRF